MMATRFRKKEPGGHPTGYTDQPSENFTIPSCGIHDIDRALFVTFRDELKLSVGKNEEGIRKVPILFAAGEKWAMIKKNKKIRDRHGSLILPLVTIVRTSVIQDITERGINQQTGELIIKRRLDESDRDYQKLINRLLIPSQQDLAVKPGTEFEGQLVTSRSVGDQYNNIEVRSGALFKTNRLKNVWEILKIPSPQFITMMYEITFWTQYMTHMDQMIDQFMSALIVPGQHFVLNTPKGYWFVATIEGDISFETNFDDQRGSERLIQSKFGMKVPGYILASDSPGAPVPVRKYVSMPVIEFSLHVPDDIKPNDEISANGFPKEDIFLGDDDPTLPIDDRWTRREDQRNLMYPDPARSSAHYTELEFLDPLTGKKIKKKLRVTNTNSSTGETVYYPESEVTSTEDFSSWITGSL